MISNKDKVEDVKRKWLDEKKTEGIDGIEQIRLFYMGKELQNAFFTYHYDMHDDMVVQVMLRKK